MIPPDANAGFVAAMEDMLDTYQKISNELMPYLAPLGWQHINLTGDYIRRGLPAHDAFELDQH